MNVPIIKLEVEGMKYAIRTALTEHAAKIDTSIQQAVEAYCTSKNIDAVVWTAATQALDAAVKEDVRNFFSSYGHGRMAVREAVQSFLDEVYPIKEKME